MADPFWYDCGEFPPEEMVAGRIVKVPLQSKQVAGVVLETGRPSLEFRTKGITGLAPGGASVPRAWIDLLQWISAYYFTPLPQVFATCLPKAALEYLFAKPGKARKAKAPAQAALPEDPARLHPNPEQEAALSAVGECLSPFKFQTFLLHGITGSGKTLVYLHLARRVLAAGRKVLVLLPEIALTPQTISRFRAFLDRPVLALHSNLSAGERRDLWRAVFAGEADIIVGARSAILCPVDGLGLIVVDEEHDGSYKQSDASPRYNARDLALYRGRQARCPVVLGSATPSLESYHASKSGKYRLLEMKTRATGSRPPRIHVVDMREQFDLQGALPISIPLREALQKALELDEQAILFLNRRGYSPRRLCRSCGEPRQCPHCVVPLVYHKAAAALKCHYCGFRLPGDAPCQKCAATTWLDVGRGIEKVEEYLQGIFPKAAMARLDRDSTSAIGAAEKILGRFRSGELQILLGTQMVAKGHDFPKVNLVGVLDADSGLGLSDFRAQERAFQLITQVSGRAGRQMDSGRVYLQTFRPDNPLLAFALEHDFQSFYRAEIERRNELEYPPFRRLLLVEITGDDETLVEEHMGLFGEAFRHFAPQADVLVLGPAFAVLKKIKDQYRAQIIGKGKAPNQLEWVFSQALGHYHPKEPHKTKLRVDMDPLSML